VSKPANCTRTAEQKASQSGGCTIIARRGPLRDEPPRPKWASVLVTFQPQKSQQRSERNEIRSQGSFIGSIFNDAATEYPRYAFCKAARPLPSSGPQTHDPSQLTGRPALWVDRSTPLIGFPYLIPERQRRGACGLPPTPLRAWPNLSSISSLYPALPTIERRSSTCIY
jgi:hypothetical protein